MAASHVSAARARLVELAAEAGPDAPTLNEGWDVRALLAHVILRERRPDAAVGLIVSPLASHTEQVQASYARRPWQELLDLVAAGPSRLSPMGWLPATADERANLLEYFVHAEDIRRASPGWADGVDGADTPDAYLDDPGLHDALWRCLAGVGRMVYRGSTIKTELVRPGGARLVFGPAGRALTVHLRGEVPELVLHVHGRDRTPGIVDVTVNGDPDAVKGYSEFRRSI